MTCFHPLKAGRSAEVNPDTGKRGITFNPTKAFVEGSRLVLPCGQCSGCRADRAFQWAMRFSHEAQLYRSNLFVTLTYDEQHVPQDFSVSLRDYQLFLKRARKRLGSFRFGGCGEYGDTTLRPHYHLGLFDLDLPDKRKVTVRGGYPVYTSETLAELWPFGSHEVGQLTHESGGYIARYVFKKMTGDKADDHYLRRSPVDGELHRVRPEFFTMSRRPGLGMGWFERFGRDAFPSDFLVVDGRKVRPPEAYLAKLKAAGEAAAGPVRDGSVLRDLSRSNDVDVRLGRARKLRAAQPSQRAEATPERLGVREKVFEARMERLVRSL